jgi:hypothetical protein
MFSSITCHLPPQEKGQAGEFPAGERAFRRDGGEGVTEAGLAETGDLGAQPDEAGQPL